VSEIKKENLSGSVSVGEALLIKMKLESSSFIFAGINCSALDDFLKVFDEIHEKGFQTSKLGLFKSASLLDLDYRVVMGSTGAQLRLS
jgi:S-methylmethionine-dependent homocysteine/selenocysteine methylase